MSRPCFNQFEKNISHESGACEHAILRCTSKRKARKLAWKLALLLMFSLTVTTTAYADEVLIGIGDGPVSDEELGITDQDLAAATDGSMIPEYKISDVTETSANVVSEQYTVAQDSGATETVKESAASGEGKETLLEIVDSVDDFAVFKKKGQSILETASPTQKNAVNAATTIIANTGSTTSSTVFTRANVIEAVTSKINSSTIPVIATTASRQALIQYAKQFLGNPYVYGGTSLTEGADCSGFVQQIFKHFGITTGRSSRDQYANAQSIRFDQLQPGDLVFYASGDYVNHVAIYAGDGVIIHAANERTGICTGRYNYREPVGYGRFIQN